MKNQFTPGPWEVFQRAKGCDIFTPAWGNIARVYSGDTYDLPNARLMAAAPDLLEACKKMLVAIESIKHVLEFTHADTSKEFTDGWEAVALAIKRAEEGNNQ